MGNFAADGGFWIALLQIIGINIVLSGDNAVVIALAARSLPPDQQKKAVMFGSGAAVVMRIVLTVVAVELLRLPYLKLVGAVLLMWIGIQLLVPHEEDEGGEGSGNASMAAAVRTILLADLVMSLDNVIAVAAAAKGSLVLLVVGLLVSIPLVVFGSTYLMKFMERWPVIVTIGGALLGWVAGEMAVGDPSVVAWIDANAHWMHYVVPATGAALVVLIGKTLAARAEARMAARPTVDLATPGDQAVPATPAGAAGAAGGSKLRFLIAADESESSLRAVDAFIRQLGWYREPVEVHLLNTQAAVHGDVSAFVANAELKDYHHEEGLKALAGARERLDRAGTPYIVHIGVGNPAHVIAHYGREKQCSQIFISELAGTASTGMVGSVATEVVRLSDVPVVLV
jgi:YjbE family integral membrane protein